jgi:hypothetical protein
MAPYYEFPVYHGVYELILQIFEYTTEFPREYTFTGGEDMWRDGALRQNRCHFF